MKYRVLHDFIEKQHKNTLYKKGEEYPKEGFKADPERVAYLQSNQNPYQIAFLASAVEEQESKEEEKQAKESSKEKESSKNQKKTPAKK